MVFWRVVGRVQGVGFRWFVRQAAVRCGVNGDVRNSMDGSVAVRAQGSAEQLERLLRDLRRGPRGARVDRVEVEEPDGSWDFHDFRIRT